MTTGDIVNVTTTPLGSAYLKWRDDPAFESRPINTFAAGWHARDAEIEQLRTALDKIAGQTAEWWSADRAREALGLNP